MLMLSLRVESYLDTNEIYEAERLEGVSEENKQTNKKITKKAIT